MAHLMYRHWKPCIPHKAWCEPRWCYIWSAGSHPVIVPHLLTCRVPGWCCSLTSHVKSGGRPEDIELPQGRLPPLLLPHHDPDESRGYFAVSMSEEDYEAARPGSYVIVFTGILVAAGSEALQATRGRCEDEEM